MKGDCIQQGIHGPNQMTLDEARRDARVRVARITGGRRLVHRLAALGIVPGAELSVIRPRGPALISIGGAHVAVGRGEACSIEVEEVTR
ncbi:MAG: FeoA domain-containing protein [Actinomycetota bacterium]|nr:FeoA domain-containing protein [Actinomycetota bacterium]